MLDVDVTPAIEVFEPDVEYDISDLGQLHWDIMKRQFWRTGHKSVFEGDGKDDSCVSVEVIEELFVDSSTCLREGEMWSVGECLHCGF